MQDENSKGYIVYSFTYKTFFKRPTLREKKNMGGWSKSREGKELTTKNKDIIYLFISYPHLRTCHAD